jgi:hypothetical protein
MVDICIRNRTIKLLAVALSGAGGGRGERCWE